MQTTTLKVKLENGKVVSDSSLNLPCALEVLGCETTSLDPYAYIWDCPDNCAILILRTEEVNMVKQGKKCYVISGADSSSKFVFQVKNDPQKPCGKPTYIYPLNYDSFYMDRLSGGFEMDTGKNLSRDQNGATKILQYLGSKENSDFTQLYAHNPTLEGTQKSQTADPTTIWKPILECTLERKLTMYSLRARNHSKRRKNSYCKTSVNRNVLKF